MNPHIMIMYSPISLISGLTFLNVAARKQLDERRLRAFQMNVARSSSEILCDSVSFGYAEPDLSSRPIIESFAT